MKVAVWLFENYSPQVGGGISYYEKFIHIIDNFSFSSDLNICFAGKNNYGINLKKEFIELGRDHSWRSRIRKHLRRFIDPINNPFLNENDFMHYILKKNKVDIILYPFQSFLAVENYPFISINWDIGHISTYSFPEILKDFDLQESWYKKTLPKALAVFVESESGRKEVASLGIKSDKIFTIPIFPGKVSELVVEKSTTLEILNQHGLIKNRFFLYPAQFWAHKNHITLIKAFKKLVKVFPYLKLVFTGADHGNKNHILRVTKEAGLADNIIFCGFVTNETLNTFYRNAAALVFPSLLGPTNMPLLEARSLRCPVLCSDLAGHREMMEEGALYFNPLCEQSLYAKLMEVLNENIRCSLIKKATEISSTSKFNLSYSTSALEAAFIDVKKIRDCWE